MKILCMLCLVLSFNTTLSQTNYLDFLPLQVGNVWVYKEVGGYPYNQCYTYQKFSIVNTTQINGETYFQISYTIKYDSSICGQWVPGNITRLFSNMLIRLDSSTGNIYTNENCGSFVNVLCDSLAARKNDSESTCLGSSIARFVCSDTSLVNLFGMNRRRKTFSHPHASGGESQSYALGIGMYSAGWSESSYWWTETLLGCVINGIVYGDTTMIVGIKQISSEVPESFSLSQNYPNPFNPTTKIKFSLPAPSKGGVQEIKLIVYNILGKEVASLIPPLWEGKEGLSPGTYEVEWDGSNYPSGVYYYTLTAGDFKETRRMVLVK